MSKMEERLKQQHDIMLAIEAEYKRSREAAAQGEALAQYNLGVIYYKGQGVQQNFAEASRYFKLAAEQGNGDAQIDLGTMYEHGHGVSSIWRNGRALHGRSGDPLRSWGAPRRAQAPGA